MHIYWGLGLVLAILVLGAVFYVLRASWRKRRDAARTVTLDLVLDDLDEVRLEPKRRRMEFTEDTAPAVLSVPPELEHPEWDNPNWEQPSKRPPAQRWLH